jgi:hypothetical protein
MIELPNIHARTLRRIERKLDLLLKDAGIEIELEEHMDAAGEALQAEVAKIDADEQTELAEIASAGTAVVEAGTKFAELKALIEKQAQGALSDEEAAQLTTLAGEVDTHIGEATTSLTSHVAELTADTAGA